MRLTWLGPSRIGVLTSIYEQCDSVLCSGLGEVETKWELLFIEVTLRGIFLPSGCREKK